MCVYVYIDIIDRDLNINIAISSHYLHILIYFPFGSFAQEHSQDPKPSQNEPLAVREVGIPFDALHLLSLTDDKRSLYRRENRCRDYGDPCGRIQKNMVIGTQMLLLVGF